MAYTISPNMNLVVPTVGSESGPQYATDVNNSLTLIDQHDHSTGKGVQIQPDGLNISSALTFQNNPLTNAQYLNMYLQTTAPTVAQSLYVKDGSESPALPDLWYFDGTNQIQITSGGELAPVTASISGITYAGGTFSFEQTQSSLPTTPANLSSGSIIIRPNTAATSYGVELNPPSAIASQYSLFLPSIPSAASFLTIDTSGNISTATNISAVQIASLSIQKTQLAALGQQISSSVSMGTSNSTSTAFTNLTVTITTTGRPVMVFLQPDGTNNPSYLEIIASNSSGLATIGAQGEFQIQRDGSVVYTCSLNVENQYTSNYGKLCSTNSPPGCVLFVDVPSAGAHTYQVYGSVDGVGSSSGVISVENVVLVAYEL